MVEPEKPSAITLEACFSKAYHLEELLIKLQEINEDPDVTSIPVRAEEAPRRNTNKLNVINIP